MFLFLFLIVWQTSLSRLLHEDAFATAIRNPARAAGNLAGLHGALPRRATRGCRRLRVGVLHAPERVTAVGKRHHTFGR